LQYLINITEQNIKPIRCPAVIRIGSRASALAIAQAEEVKNRLLGSYPELRKDQIIIIPIKTMGDIQKDAVIADIGGKGMFTKELEEALLRGDINFAVHSLKDVPDILPKGLIVASILRRNTNADVFVSYKYKSLAELPKNAVIGTSAIRRKAYLLKANPNFNIYPLRGNIRTRLLRLKEGVKKQGKITNLDGIILAESGLQRLFMQQYITQIITEDYMLPAASQGTIGIECREEDIHIKKMVEMLGCKKALIEVKCERAFLHVLNGSCRSPIGARACLKNGKVYFRGALIASNGAEICEITKEGDAMDYEKIGREAGEYILQNASKKLLEELQPH